MKVRVAVLGTIGKSVIIDTDAGAQIGVNLRLPNGQVATIAQLQELFGSNGTAVRHRLLQGLQDGDDHPQYTMWAAAETIKGQWDFQRAIWGADGTAAAPAYTFTTDKKLGMFRSGVNTLGFAVDNFLRMSLTDTIFATGVLNRTIDGTSPLPAYSFTNDPDTGIYRSFDNTMAMSTAGALRWEMSTTLVSQSLPLRIANNSGILIQNQGIAAGDSNSTAGIELTSINGFDPSDECGNTLAFWEGNGRTTGFRFRHEGDVDLIGDLALYRHDADPTGIKVFEVSRTSSQIRFNAGTVGDPILSTLSDQNTGIYFPAADTIGFSTGGTQRLRIDTADVIATVPYLGPVGSASVPTYSFSGDDDTGIYRVSNGVMGFTSGAAGGTWLEGSHSAGAKFNSQILAWSGGGIAAPPISFQGDPDTGFYSEGANSVGFSAGGFDAYRFNQSGIYVFSNRKIFNTTAGGPSAPAYTFDGDDNTGMTWGGDNTIDFATAGSRRFTIDTAALTSTLQHRGPDGSAALPTYSFTTGTGTSGMYRIGTDNIGFSVGGTLRLDLNTTRMVSALVLQAPDGSASAPAYGFSQDTSTNTGMYRIGENNIGFTLGGTLRLDMTTTVLTTTLAYRGQDGSNSAPALSFSGDTDTGLYRIGADNLGVTIGGTLRLDANTTDLVSTLRFRGPAGAVGTPTYSFSGDTNTGMWGPAADTIAFSVAGAIAVQIGPLGQLGLGSTPDYGSTGEVLTSQGPGAAPIWDAGGGAGAPASLTYITEADETADLPNSLQLLAGGGVLFTPGTNTLTISATGGADFANSVEVADDLINHTANFSNFTNGAGAAVALLAPVAGRPGIVEFSTGTTATGQAGFGYQPTGGTSSRPVLMGGGEITYEARVRFPTVPTAGEDFTCRLGLADELNGAPTDGVYFAFGASGGVYYWGVVARAAGVSTTTIPTTVALAANTWYLVQLVVNSAGTSVVFKVNGTTIHTETTGLPTAGMTFGAQCQKSAGTTARTLQVDTIYFRQVFSSAR